MTMCIVLFFSRMKVANFDFSKKCHQIAEVTKGLSGREISKIAIAWQVRAQENCKKTKNVKTNKSLNSITRSLYGFVVIAVGRVVQSPVKLTQG